MNVEIKDGKLQGWLTPRQMAKKWDMSYSAVITAISKGHVPKSNVITIKLSDVYIVRFIKEDTPSPKIKMSYSFASTGYTRYKLTDVEKDVLKLHEKDKLPFTEIAKKLNIRYSKVTSIYKRAVLKAFKSGKSLEEAIA